MLKIGQMAKRLGLNIRTLRYYEEIGLLPPPARTEGGYRLYSASDERLLRFVLQARQAGFRLNEIRHILQRGKDGRACGYVREAIAGHIADADARIADLQRLRARLARMAESDPAEDGADGCICGLIEHWPGFPDTTKEETEMARKVEVFTAGCAVCAPTVELVKRIACDDCDVTVHNVTDDPQAADRARTAGVRRIPAVLVDGALAACCEAGPVTEAGLRASGIGAA